MITRQVVSRGLLPALIVAGVLAASLLVRPVGIDAVNVATCTYGYGGAPTVTGIAPNSGPAAGGTVVTITGCGFTGALRTHFGALPATRWVIINDSKIQATSPAQPAGTMAGIRVATSKGTSQFTPADVFTYTGANPICGSVTLTAAPASPSTSGTQVTLTGSATGCFNPNYEFWAKWAGTSAWQLLQAYSTTATYVWNSTGAASGTETFGVWARDTTSSNQYDALTSIPYTVTGPTCTAVTLSAAPASPQPSGTQVTLTAAATGCTNANPQYEFWAKWAGTSAWQMLQAYSTSATYVWNSTGAVAGTETFGVWARDSKSTAAYDALGNTTYTVTTPSCTTASASAAPTTVVHGSGTHVTITAVGSGCTTTPRYEFWMRTSSTSWQLVQSYSATATYDWNSTGAAAGTVFFGVWVRDANSTAAYDALASTTVTVT